jgi:hypothetical protein
MDDASCLETLVEDLILARLIAPPKGYSEGALKKDLGKFFSELLGESQWNDLFGRVLPATVSRGLAAPKPLALSEQGASEARRRWKIGALPARDKWNFIRKFHIVPRLSGIQAERLPRGKYAEALARALLVSEYGLKVDSLAPSEVLNALMWKLLNLPGKGEPTANKLVSQIALGDKPQAKLPALCTKLAKKATDCKPRGDLVTAAIQSSIKRRGQKAPAQAKPPVVSSASIPTADNRPPDLAAFASRVRSAAQHAASGRFGDDKVFVSHVWKALEHDPAIGCPTRDEFYQQLLDAHRKGLLELTRADLVERMDRNDVAQSEIRYLSSTFHLLTIPSKA